MFSDLLHAIGYILFNISFDFRIILDISTFFIL